MQTIYVRITIAALSILLMLPGAGIAQSVPMVGNQPLLQIRPVVPSLSLSGLVAKLRECLVIDDMTKERLDCYDAVVPPDPKDRPPVVKIVTDCRFQKEEDDRLNCFNRFLVRQVQRTLPSAAQSRPRLPSAIDVPTVKQTYIKRGRGGCGSRGGAGYRLPNGKCASRKR